MRVKTLLRVGTALSIFSVLGCVMLGVSVFRLNADFRKLRGDVRNRLDQEQANNADKGLPIGSIVAWHPNFFPADEVPQLAGEWVRCDGQDLNDVDSPLHKKKIPNLNGEFRFLRGGNTSGHEQEDTFKKHFHRFSGVSFYAHDLRIFEDPGGAHAETGLVALTWGDTKLQMPKVTDVGCGVMKDEKENYIYHDNNEARYLPHLRTNGNRKTFTDDAGAIWDEGDDETRPKNMSVVWIMRVK